VTEEVNAWEKMSFLRGDTIALDGRGITKETCQHWGYQVAEAGTPSVMHIATYRDVVGNAVAQKIRRANKQFNVVGNGKNMPLYGMWLWGKGKSVTITEGEIDALTVSQVFNNRWPVVSVPAGAHSADKALTQHLEWLDGFDKIVLMFDQDDAGREATEKAAMVLPAGKVFIANLPAKDANATLLEHGPGAVTQAFWNASPWRPDGIIHGSSITREKLKEAVAEGIPFGYPKLDAMTYGLRKGELTMLTAGTGIGKSTLAREVGYRLLTQHGLKIGNVFLEEPNIKTAQAYAAIHYSVPLKDLRRDTSLLADSEWDEALSAVVHRMWFYDHFGSLESNALLAKLRYLASAEKVDFIILDHISIVVSGQSSEEGERKDIDILMTRLRTLIEQTGVGVIAITHLNQPMGTPHEEGGRVTLRHLRGSGSLKQLSDNVYALERDQQDEEKGTQSQLRVLKCRETGETGTADLLQYNRTTGRLELAKVAQL
jgi:twinkle protein